MQLQLWTVDQVNIGFNHLGRYFHKLIQKVICYQYFVINM